MLRSGTLRRAASPLVSPVCSGAFRSPSFLRSSFRTICAHRARHSVLLCCLLSFQLSKAAAMCPSGYGPLAYFFKGRREQDFLHSSLHVPPSLLQPAARAFHAHPAEHFVVDAARFRKRAVNDSQYFANRDLLRRSRQRVASIDAPPAFQDAAALQFQQDLFQVFQRDVVPLGDFVNRQHSGILQRQIKNRLCRVLAFCRDSHRSSFSLISVSHARLPVNLARLSLRSPADTCVCARKDGCRI